MINIFKTYTSVLLLLFMVTPMAYAAKIHKWIDTNGETHYSATPPQKQITKSMGSTGTTQQDSKSDNSTEINGCENATKKDLLYGVWALKEDKRTRFRFYDGWIEARANGDRIPRYFIDVRKGNVQSGRWSVKGDMLKLYIDKVGKGDGALKQVKRARIHKVDKFELYLLIDDTQSMKFKRDTSSGHKPKCMRRK